MPEILFFIFAFLFGAICGSFLNVLIDRIPKREDIVFKRSHCDHCQTVLSYLDLVPIFSYLLLWGKCRYCGRKISLQNLLVEFATGLIFMFYMAFYINSHFGISNLFTLIFQLAVICLLLVIFVIDLKKSIIPDSLVFILTVFTLIYKVIWVPGSIWPGIFAGLVFAMFFMSLVLITKGRGMGLGDVKLAFFMGLYLGFEKLIAAFYLAFLTGTIISLILVFGGRKTFKSKIPFGPFLVGGTVIANFFGSELVSIFLNFMVR